MVKKGSLSIRRCRIVGIFLAGEEKAYILDIYKVGREQEGCGNVLNFEMEIGAVFKEGQAINWGGLIVSKVGVRYIRTFKAESDFSVIKWINF